MLLPRVTRWVWLLVTLLTEPSSPHLPKVAKVLSGGGHMALVPNTTRHVHRKVVLIKKRLEGKNKIVATGKRMHLN